MAKELEVKVPDIGSYDGVPVIDLLVKVGDKVEKKPLSSPSNPTKPRWTCRRPKPVPSRASRSRSATRCRRAMRY